MLVPFERAVISVLPGADATSKVVGVAVQYALVVLVSFGVVWLVINSARRKRLGLPIGIVAIELLAISWVCLLYETFFQPLPSLLALGLGYGAANGYSAFMGRNRSRLARDLFAGRLAQNQIDDILAGDLAFEAEAKSHEVTAVVCDIANKHDLAEECSPAVLAEVTQKFIRTRRSRS
jgi:hypothetical protein